MSKPEWWPKNPYPETIFVMKRERYPEIVPEPDLRTGLSGMLGREFWDIASKSIWDALRSNLADVIEPFDEPEKSAIKEVFGL